jgi:uncharacterized coiled-coil protein SlyX
MPNGILKGLAVAAGTGLAMGLTSGRVRVRPVARRADREPGAGTPTTTTPAGEPDDEFLNIEPLLERLESLEARVETMEFRPGSAKPTASEAVLFSETSDYAALLADLDRRVEVHTRELAVLHKSIGEAERRLSVSVESVERTVAQTREEMPAFVERQLAARIGDLEKRLNGEIEQAQQRTIATFERVIDEKIASRISSMEKALADQAGSIASLSARTAETDNNLQRLVTAIERLCERAQLIPAAPERRPAQPAQYESRLPFESQLSDAMGREPVVPVLRTAEREAEVQVAAPAFVAKEPAAPKKSRFFFGNLLIAGFGLLAARFLR